MFRKNKINISILSVLLLIISFYSYSQNLYWAGFAFIGNKDQNFRYPVAISIFEEEKSLLSKKLKETLKSLKRNDVNIIFDQGKISSGDAKALAFGVMDESLERIITEYGISTHYSIYGQVMIFDYNDKRMIANYPVLVRYTSITDEIPSKENKKFLWQKDHQENLTGTENSYKPNKIEKSDNQKKYESWKK